MDLNFNLLTMDGKKYISVLIDHFIKYLHSLTIYVQCIASQEGKIILGFHGQSRDNILMEIALICMTFGKCGVIVVMIS